MASKALWACGILKEDRSATSPPRAAGIGRKLNRPRAPRFRGQGNALGQQQRQLGGMRRSWLPWVACRRAHQLVKQPYEAGQPQRQCESGMAQVIPERRNRQTE